LRHPELDSPAGDWEIRVMSTIEHSIVINRPIDDVFRFVHKPQNDPSWQTTLIECQQVEEGPVGVGTQVRERRRFLGIQVEMTKEITEYEPFTSSAFTYVSGGAPMSGRYRLEPLDGATKLTAIGYVEPRGFFRWAEPLFSSMAGRELEASLGHLKDLLEVGPEQILLEEPA
jgi:uncharacterized membrane protein